MRKVILLVVLGCLALTSVPTAQQAGPLRAAADALGVTTVKSLQFVGAGAAFQLGQNFTPAEPWPPVLLKSYTVMINFDTKSMRIEQVRDLSVTQPRGGGASFSGAEQRQIQVVGGDFAWNVAAAPAAPAAPAGGAAAGGGRAGGAAPGGAAPGGAAPGGAAPGGAAPGGAAPGGAAPAAGAPAAVAGAAGGGQAPAPPQPTAAPANWEERMLGIWTMPQGFVMAALANNATTRAVTGGTEVSFTVGGKYKMTGLINSKNQVQRVQTWIDHPLVGDMLVETEFSPYYDFGGVMFPSHILQKQDGHPTLNLAVASVTLNPPVDIAIPDNVRTASAPGVTVTATKLADGVFHMTGGSHHSLAVEMNDHIVLVDTPQTEARALAVIAKTKETIPNKPIRFVVTSHHHWDHLGGIRAAIDEGATIVTAETNKELIERLATTPHTIKPDRLATSKKAVKVQAVGPKGTLTDGTRTIELHTLTNYLHVGGMLVVYLPKEKILAEADAYTPPPQPTATIAAPAVRYAAMLYDNIQRLKLDVQTIAPLHGARTSDMAELAKNAGRAPAAPATR